MCLEFLVWLISEEKTFMICTVAHHQRVIEVLHFLGVYLSSIILSSLVQSKTFKVTETLNSEIQTIFTVQSFPNVPQCLLV